MEPFANSSDLPEENTARVRRPSYQSYASWLRQCYEPHEILSQKTADCGTCSITHVRMAEAFSDPPTSDLTLALVSTVKESHEHRFDFGFGEFRDRPRTGILALFTPDVPTGVCGPGPYDLLTVSAPWTKLRPQLEDLLEQDCPHLPPRFHSELFFDATIEDSIHRLHRITRQDSTNTQIAFDELINAILMRLVSIGGLKNPVPKSTARLSKQDLHRVLDFIDYNKGVSVSLDDLADVAGCSRFHFSRLFKATTGSSPMEHVLRWRIGRVREALERKSDVALATIAIENGFADQAHMGRQFKRIVGTTPKQFRNQR